MKERTILHSDVNNFFASVEQVCQPSLAGKPVAVAGNPKKRTGIVLAKNELAKARGVKTGQAIWEAKAACPDLVCLPPHYDLYEKISKQLAQIYLEYTDKVEPLGLDECWLDVSGCEKYLGKNGKQIADELRVRIKQQFGFTVSVGVSFNKIFAKLGSDMKKPDATTIIDKDHFQMLTYHLPLSSIVGIGGRLEKKFGKININTIGDYVQLEDEFLKEFVSIAAVNLKKQLLGIDQLPVLSYYNLPPPKSIGNGSTAIVDIKTKQELTKMIYFLAEKVSKRLITAGFESGTVAISIKTADFERYAKSCQMPPTNSAKNIAQTALSLLDSFWKYDTPVRAVRLRCTNLERERLQQLSIFEPQRKDASKIVNQIAKKYGKIGLASDFATFINNSPHPHE